MSPSRKPRKYSTQNDILKAKHEEMNILVKDVSGRSNELDSEIEALKNELANFTPPKAAAQNGDHTSTKD